MLRGSFVCVCGGVGLVERVRRQSFVYFVLHVSVKAPLSVLGI